MVTYYISNTTIIVLHSVPSLTSELGTRVLTTKAAPSPNDGASCRTSALVPAFDVGGRLQQSYPWSTTPSRTYRLRARPIHRTPETLRLNRPTRVFSYVHPSLPRYTRNGQRGGISMRADAICQISNSTKLRILTSAVQIQREPMLYFGLRKRAVTCPNVFAVSFLKWK